MRHLSETFKTRQKYETYFNLVSDNESENENEEEEWEAQQIRKGVTGAQVKAKFNNKLKLEKIFDGLQIVAAQQDSMLQQQYTMGMNVNQMMGSNVSLEMVLMPAPPPPPSIQPPDPTKIVPVTPQEVVNRMRIRFYMLLRKYFSQISQKNEFLQMHIVI